MPNPNEIPKPAPPEQGPEKTLPAQEKKVELKHETREDLARFQGVIEREQLAKDVTKEDLDKNEKPDRELLENLKKLAATNDKTPLDAQALEEFEDKYGKAA